MDRGEHVAYPEADRLAALELAAAVGIAPAAQHLGVSRKSIYRWIDKYPQVWSDLRAGDREAQKRGIAARLEDLADRYGAAENDLLENIEDGKFKPKDAKEAAALLKAMGSSRQTATVGARSARGEDNVAQEHNINFPQIEAAMERLLGGGAPPALPVPNEAEDHARLRS